MSTVLQFPRFKAYRPKPEAVRLAFDFGDWCAELRCGGKLARRVRCASLEEACAEIRGQEAAGLRRLPDAPMPEPIGGEDVA